MSIYAHVMCEACLRKSKLDYADLVDLTRVHAERRCCWCEKAVEFSLIVNRHPNAVKCKGKHE